MRITVDIPDDLLEQATSIAHDTSRTLSKVAADLIRHGLRQGTRPRFTRSELTGLPVINLGLVVTTEDVRALEDDD